MKNKDQLPKGSCPICGNNRVTVFACEKSDRFLY